MLTKIELLKELNTWSANLKSGDPVLMRWTNSGQSYQIPATVVRVNEKTVVAALKEAVGTSYSESREIRTPRFGFFTDWTWHNVALPADFLTEKWDAR